MTGKVCEDGKDGGKIWTMINLPWQVRRCQEHTTQTWAISPCFLGKTSNFISNTHTSAHTNACAFFIEGIWEIRRKCERGKIFPSLIIIITVSSPFSDEQMGIGCGIFLLFLLFFTLFLFKLIPHHPASCPTTKWLHSLTSEERKKRYHSLSCVYVWSLKVSGTKRS